MFLQATKGNEKEHNGAAAVPAVQAMDVAEQANGDAGGEHDSGKEGPVDAAASSDNNNSNSDQGDEIVTANTNDRPDAGSQSPPGRYDDAQESPAFAVTNGDDQEDGAEDDTPEKEEMETGVKSNSKGRRAVGKSSAKFELKE